ncbi:MAG: glycosyltransferase family 4 protein, partial [Nitrospinae bacterium]|nr:glycosyltransferase family 4 protein [Nitrospinota bacterium]
MKLLLSAYACQPGTGSEPGVGWRWSVALAERGHDVWVLTPERYRLSIEAEQARGTVPGRLRFIYHALPRAIDGWGGTRSLLRLHNYLWQLTALAVARKAHASVGFDLVHHLTWGGFRFPSLLGCLGVPFVFGPVGGGEKAPWRLRPGYGLRGWIIELLRDLSDLLLRFDPLVADTFDRAFLIAVKTPDTLAALPPRHRAKGALLLEIGIAPPADPPLRALAPGEPFRVLYVGQFLYWKGMSLGFEGFARLLAVRPDARLTMVGKGPDEAHWRALAHKAGVDAAIDWVPWVEQSRLPDYYRSAHCFLFPSLHDSSGNAVLEALSHGLPVVCLDIGGPAVVAGENAATIV